MDATVIVAALNSRADVLEAEAQQIRNDDHTARAGAGNAALRVFIKDQVAQEFRNLAVAVVGAGVQ